MAAGSFEWIRNAIFKTASGAGTVSDPYVLAVDGSSASGSNVAPTGSAYTSKSIASLAGSSETLAAANAARKELFIQNIGNADVWVNIVGGAAAASTADSIVLGPRDSVRLTHLAIVKIIGTAGQPVTAVES